MAFAEAETVHAKRHPPHIKAVKSARENLRVAMAGEMQEFKKMCPQIIAEPKTVPNEAAPSVVR